MPHASDFADERHEPARAEVGAAAPERRPSLNFRDWAVCAVDAVAEWQAGFGAYESHPSLEIGPDALARGLAELSERLTGITRSFTRVTRGR
ncbi:hypothetical protein OV079_50895 [Nannocystis pusilla]|uniref:Uncharacterized protein n=1 Tax=Nannocystis pusilla TaxID=889268 RepID=A0A9X3F3D5_9BACT|nr:hypothetical protein [Nannocystis pusilla]MCY1013704.1 hypothetical protein [Nannocystis pusilla]